MERCFTEKAGVITDIRVKYEMKIKECEDTTEIGTMLQLKTDMEEEIARMSLVMDAKRK
jgi:hypothetical protein